MSNKMVDVILHVDEDSSHDDRESFRDKLMSINGVHSADFRDDKPHLVVVEYDPELVKPNAFLSAASENDGHAELVGL